MIISIDLDCVVNNLMDKTLEAYNKQNNKNIQLSNITSYDFYECLDKTDAEGLIKLFKNKSLWDSLTPLVGAKEGVRELIESGHRVYLVTATAPENFAWKVQWLKRFFPYVHSDNIVRLMDKSLFKCDIMIDDCLDQLLKHKLCHRVCFDYPWNRSIDDFVYDIKRCTNWKEILEVVNEIEKEIKKYE